METRGKTLKSAGFVCAVLVFLPLSAYGGDWSGYIAGEVRYFPSNPLDSRQEHGHLSLSFRPEYQHSWDDGYQRFVFAPFFRWDQRDSRRTHGDIRELYWEKSGDRYDLRIGIRKVFWGVVESVHLVDIINQTDLVENPDTEEKLGQPMINFAWISDWGVLDFYLMPVFRERTFPGVTGRLRPPLPVDAGKAEYESSLKEFHPDWAVRWSRYIGAWDIGLYHFMGTSREPRLLPESGLFRRLAERGGGGSTAGAFRGPLARYAARSPLGRRARLVPFYDQIHQTGLDVQYTAGSWLWKLEAIHRSGQGRSYTALAAGFEYTFFDVRGTGIDVGVLAEYLYDSRGDDALTFFADDIFLGTRMAFNDPQDTNILAGIIVDTSTGSTFWNVEASRRLGDAWRLNVEARIFTGVHSDELAYVFRKDDYIQVELAWHF